MQILILGGTAFLGRALVEAALDGGHQVTIFHRGKTNPGMFPQVEELLGDRMLDLSPLASRNWDAVIDTSGYVPRHVRASALALTGSCENYTFISSLSVYADSSQPGVAEDGELAKMADELVEDITGETYGPLKVLCEEAVAQEMGADRTLIIRPGLIVGPHDPTDRFTYWPHRVAEGGEVLAPGSPARAIQFIDVRDLAEWTLRMALDRASGVYNANGPSGILTMGDFLDTCKIVSGSDARFTWVSEEFLVNQNVGPWMEVPLWVPELDPENAGFFAFDSSKAIAAGLTFRPLPETVRATLDWLPERPSDRAWRAGLVRERERELLEAWRVL